MTNSCLLTVSLLLLLSLFVSSPFMEAQTRPALPKTIKPQTNALLHQQAQQSLERPPDAIAEPEPLSIVAEEPFRSWKSIIIHHSATANGNVATIHAAHRLRLDAQGRPWRGIGYHFVIGNGQGMTDGELQATFRWEEQSAGAHAGVLEHNEYGIGICLIGNFETDKPTAQQLATAQKLISLLQTKFGITNHNVYGHRDVNETKCPGQNFGWKSLLTAEKTSIFPVPRTASFSKILDENAPPPVRK